MKGLEESEKKVRCLFGTDGVRDVANRGVMTPEMALRLGRSYVLYLTERGVPRPRIVVGRDTRRSGKMLEDALVAGMLSAGAQVLTLGVIPTPGVSFAVKHIKAQGGVVISASHNPAEYNGIKFLNNEGHKLNDDAEAAIEDYLGDDLIDDWRPTGASIGEVQERIGLLTRGSISLGTSFVAGRKRVPNPATGKRHLETLCFCILSTPFLPRSKN